MNSIGIWVHIKQLMVIFAIKTSQYLVLEENGANLFGRLSASVSRNIWPIQANLEIFHLFLFGFKTFDLRNKKKYFAVKFLYSRFIGVKH